MVRIPRRKLSPTLLLIACASAAEAQQERVPFVCTGQIVSRVEIQPAPPAFAGRAKTWRAIAHAIGLHHATTQSEVIEAFLSLTAGKHCTEFRRAESERVLRAQPYLSDATVRVERDTGGTVSVFVTTTDEIPVLVAGRFRGISPEAFALGNDNIGGAAFRLSGRVERGGRAYPTALGIGMQKDALFGHPYRFIFDADRYQVGHRINAEIEHPFFTDLQRISWHAGTLTSNDFFRVERPAGDALALPMTNRGWEASGLLRVFGTGTVALIGGALANRQFDPAREGIIVSDSGLQPDTGVALRNRYQPFRVGRVGMLAGLRRVTFRSVNGFDALIGSQDVMNGAMLGVYAAKGFSGLGDNDILLSGALYLGASSRNALFATVIIPEVRHANEQNQWNSGIGSSRTAFYWGNAPGVVLVVDNEMSWGWRSVLPLQLTFRDPLGGLIGYRNSGLAGATRSISRAEVRWSMAERLRKADVGLAAFTEVGQLWKGDVPYGVNATRTSLGISLLAAYPTRSKRLYRADLAFPLSPSGINHSRRIELRFSNADKTQGFWIEPGDVARSRTGVEPHRLFAWPTQ